MSTKDRIAPDANTLNITWPDGSPLDTSTGLSEALVVDLFYDASQPRDADGRWSKAGSAARKAAYIAGGYTPEVARNQVQFENDQNAEQLRIKALRAHPITGGMVRLPDEVRNPIALDEQIPLLEGLSHDYPEVVEATAEAIAGEFERSTGATDVTTSYGQGYVEIEGRLTAGGTVDGSFKRTFVDNGDGGLLVTHNIFQMAKNAQGTGIGSKFIADSEKLYASWGGAEVQLHANIDVGGYAWARMGFDFMSPDSIPRILGNIADQYVSNNQEIPPELFDASRRMKDAMIGKGSAPTAFELSQWGRTPGAKDWLGKRAMLGSDWEGYKVIPSA